MELYVGIYLFLWIICVLASFKVQRSLPLIIIVSLIVILFQGLRWRTGSDWQAYLDCFELSNHYKVEYVEFGYYWLNRFVRYFTNSYTIFLIIESSIIVGCIWKFATEFKSPNIPVVICTFFSTNIFPTRFTLACAIFMLSYRYIKNQQFCRFLLIYFIASSMHQIVTLTLPLYFISAKFYKDVTLFVAYGICCGVGLLTDWMFGNIMNSLNIVFAYLPEFSQDKANFYINLETESRSILTNILSFANGAIFIFLFVKIRTRIKDSGSYNILLNMYVFGLCISRLVLNTIPYLSRINLCCTGGFSIMLLYGIYHYKQYRAVLVSIFALYMYFSYTSQISTYPDLFIPYYSVFSNTERPIVY